ncbi:hypothetical protein KDH_61240 [Dictyobacter sp. S3.2.2.5]|uniref:N-acetyltransferase domain-containing protein n=1 Tax=Dictyobacter halimunensis TaxID=3026934 RepID=A0ABQ6FZU3_9CHLR|nr:hypothetical protein KDH_61240 [Dictyobacter sp. S3.2.2.5]
MSIALAQCWISDLEGVSWFVRPATCAEEDQQFLTLMCYLSAFPMRHCRMSGCDAELVARLPQIAPWRSGWGRPGDIALLAVDTMTRRRLGAIWCRLFSSPDDFVPGFYASDIPIIALAVEVHARRRGIGQSLLSTLKQIASQRGYSALSLSVSTNSPARRLYERNSFIAQDIQSHPDPTSMSVTL